MLDLGESVTYCYVKNVLETQIMDEKKQIVWKRDKLFFTTFIVSKNIHNINKKSTDITRL